LSSHPNLHTSFRRLAARWGRALAVFAVVAGATAASAAPAQLRITGDEAAGREYFSAWERVSQARAYRKRVTTGGQTIVIEVVNPNRQRMIIGEGASRQEIVTIGQEFRIRAGNGPYMCLPPQARPQFGGPDPDPQHAQGEVNVTRLPNGTIEGVAVRGYLVAFAVEGRSIRMRGWVSANGDLRRVEFLNAAGNVETTTDYYDVNAAITIELTPCP
jgi:hypothetical protein